MPSAKSSSTTAVIRQRNPRGDGARLKVQVIEAAMRLLDSRPASELSLRMVAKEVGVAAPSIYAHFPDADAMMRAIVRECWLQMGEAMVRAGNSSRSKTALGILKTQMRAFVRYAMERSSRYQLLFAIALKPSELDLDGPLRPAYRPVIESIERLQKEIGKLPAKDATSAALLVLSLAHGRIALAHLAPLRTGNMRPDVEKFVLESLDHLFA